MSSSQTNHLSQLRALAQQHLQEIESEKAEEQAQQSQAEADIERYAKTSSFGRKKLANDKSRLQDNERYLPPDSQEQSTSDVDSKKQHFRPFQDILFRLRWDPKLDIEDYVVGYLERFEGMKEMPAGNWIRDFSEEEWIPMHRVRYVKRVRSRLRASMSEHGPEIGIVWDRDGRIDKLSRTQCGMATVELSTREDVLSIDGSSVTGGMAL